MKYKVIKEMPFTSMGVVIEELHNSGQWLLEAKLLTPNEVDDLVERGWLAPLPEKQSLADILYAKKMDCSFVTDQALCHGCYEKISKLSYQHIIPEVLEIIDKNVQGAILLDHEIRMFHRLRRAIEGVGK